MADDGGPGPEGTAGSLADALGALRRELAADVSRARSADPQFEVAEVEVEFSVETTRNAEGGVALWVVDAATDIGAPARGPASHQIKLRLKTSDVVLGGSAFVLGDEAEAAPSPAIARSWDEGDLPR